MARYTDLEKTDFYRVIVSYQHVDGEGKEGPIKTSTLGLYDKPSYARGAAFQYASGYWGWRRTRLIERRVQKLVAVGTVTVVTDENGNEERTLGARLEWKDI